MNRLEDKTAGKVTAEKYAEINRHLQSQEHREALQIAQATGLWRFDERRPLWG